ncbi:MAG: PorT family protein [Bacteroidetes bacterium]|nr:PorT family protein [Bacteroidota bacterium]
MKKVLALILLVSFAFASHAQDFRFGIQGAPVLSWLKPDVRTISSTGFRVGFKYGLIFDYNFTDNYSISTGFNVTSGGGNVKYDDSLTFDTTNYGTSAEIKHKLKYLEIPINLKLRTNEIGYMKYFVQVGVTPSFKFFKARADICIVDVCDVYDDYNDGVGFANIAFSFGAGVEYNLGGNTSAVAALVFKNGIIDITSKDVDDAKVIMNYIALNLAIMF